MRALLSVDHEVLPDSQAANLSLPITTMRERVCQRAGEALQNLFQVVELTAERGSD
jgi:hypothetical protein